MNEIQETLIKKIINKIYKDALVTNIPNKYFLQLEYSYDHFKTLIQDKKIFHSILGYLSNTNYQSRPFILSVAYNKGADKYEIIVKNPRINNKINY